MPTAPEILPTRTASRARRRRSRSRPSSAYHSASFRPKVIGSACTPCVRPIIGVRRCLERARRRRRAARRDQRRMTSHRLAHLQRLRGVDDVRRGETEVQPARRRADVFGDRGGERDHVVLGGLLDLLDAGDVEARRSPSDRAPHRRAPGRRRPSRRRPPAPPGATPRSGAARSRCGPSRGWCSAESCQCELLRGQSSVRSRRRAR